MRFIPEKNATKWIPPPGGITKYYNDVPNCVEILQQQNYSCKACYTVSRDIGVLGGERTPDEAEKLRVFHWNFGLVDIIDGAESGCHFCGVFVVYYLTGKYCVRVLGRGGFNTETIACCSLARGAREQSDDVREALQQLRELSENNPKANLTFVVEPLDYERRNARFASVRFSALSGRDIEVEAFSEMVRGLDFDLEFFAEKGR